VILIDFKPKYVNTVRCKNLIEERYAGTVQFYSEVRCLQILNVPQRTAILAFGLKFKRIPYSNPC